MGTESYGPRLELNYARAPARRHLSVITFSELATFQLDHG